MNEKDFVPSRWYIENGNGKRIAWADAITTILAVGAGLYFGANIVMEFIAY